jgi:hypothetical protein
MPGGVTLVVAVVFALSFDCWQPARIKSRAHAIIKGRECFGKGIVSSKKAGGDIGIPDFTPSLITKSGQGTSLPEV